jgi:hypothetical protein
MHAHEMHVYEMHTYETPNGREMHAHELGTRGPITPRHVVTIPR